MSTTRERGGGPWGGRKDRTTTKTITWVSRLPVSEKQNRGPLDQTLERWGLGSRVGRELPCCLWGLRCLWCRADHRRRSVLVLGPVTRWGPLCPAQTRGPGRGNGSPWQTLWILRQSEDMEGGALSLGPPPPLAKAQGMPEGHAVPPNLHTTWRTHADTAPVPCHARQQGACPCVCRGVSCRPLQLQNSRACPTASIGGNRRGPNSRVPASSCSSRIPRLPSALCSWPPAELDTAPKGSPGLWLPPGWPKGGPTRSREAEMALRTARWGSSLPWLPTLVSPPALARSLDPCDCPSPDLWPRDSQRD